MKTMTKVDYKKAYKALKAERAKGHTAISDLVKCIDKMLMLGGKMKALDAEIQTAIWSKKYEETMPDFERWCWDELDALTYMSASLSKRVAHHKLINRCKDKGDSTVCDFIKDFETLTLMVKSREMAVKETMLKLISLRHLKSDLTLVG